MKLYFVALLCCMAINPVAKPNKRTAPHDATESTNNAPCAIPFNENQESKAQENTAKNSPLPWYAPFQRSEWWLVIVATLTAGAIFWQSRETRRAAEAALRSITLQEAQLGQWLDIEDVDVQVPIHQFIDGELTLMISFQIVNPTRMVLTLKEMSVTLFNESPAIDRLEHTLPPANNYPYRTDVSLSGEALRKYTHDTYIIPLVGVVGFEDAFRKLQHYNFGFDIHCRQNGFELKLPDRTIKNG